MRLDFVHDGGGLGKVGMARLSVDGAPPREVRAPSTIRLLFPLLETFDVGEDTGTPWPRTTASPAAIRERT